MSRFVNIRMFINFMTIKRKSVNVWLYLLILCVTIVKSRDANRYYPYTYWRPTRVDNLENRIQERTLDELGLTTDSAGALFLGAVNLFINIYYKLEIGDLKDRIADLENGSTGTSTATVNCVWASWNSWSTCSITCGTGTRIRSRRIQSLEQNGGTCTGDIVETLQEDCGTCPTDNDVTALETKVENLLDSLNNICDTLEFVSKEVSAGTTNDIYHCCYNKDIGKMNCLRNSVQLFITDQSLKISQDVEGRCGRCSTGETGDPTSCANYLGGYCDE